MANLECVITAFLLLLSRDICFGRTIYPPIITSLQVNGQANPFVVTSLSIDLKLECQPDANVDASTTYNWTVNGSPPSNSYVVNGATMTLQNYRFSPGLYTVGQYDGNYECTAKNSQGTAVSSPAAVKVGAFIGTYLPTSAPAAVPMSFSPGSTLILPCNSSVPLTYLPSIWSLSPAFVWFGTLINAPPGTFGRVELVYTQDSRYTFNDYGTLFIRNSTRDQFSSFKSISCYIKDSSFSSELAVGVYNMQPTSTPGTLTTAPTLLYKSPDLTVPEGASFFLSCIFDDQGGAIALVNWNNYVANRQDGGARIQIINADVNLPSSWICTYVSPSGKSATGTITVSVIPYPEISGLQDTIVTTGSVAVFTCRVRPLRAATFKWYKNGVDVPLTKYVSALSADGFSSTLTISNVDKSDISVITCAASNTLATRKKGVRLLVKDPTTVSIAAILDNPVAGKPGNFPVNSNTTAIRFLCNYTLDSSISGEKVVWQMQAYSGDIDEKTLAPDFGLQLSSVVTQTSQKQSALNIQYTPESSRKILGSVNCSVLYQILGQSFRVGSGNTGQITVTEVPPPLEITTVAQFPYWIIGVIVAALFLILLVFLIIFCVQRNKGEQYYVGKKEMDAGHDPKEDRPTWQDFNRPDQDPVKGSRASLEMEGERPIGSDTGSMDEYGVDTETGKFNEDGSFIGQYGPKGQRSGATGHV